ncbi:MAG: sigma-70 family RNA polymerase sigma factor [Actinobacteria bacterium]|nr:MAG: sigma-70 family RNA polymerase sigma factor [Actinomycetota bacterium]
MLDDTTIREFLRDDYPRLVNAVALLTGDLPAAEDAVQEALVRAWIRSDRGDVIESLPAWVAVVAMNLTRSGWRRVTAERRARALLASVVADDSRGVDRVDIQRALAGLPRRQRQIAVLRYFLQMDTREVADALGVSEGTVKNSLSKARDALAVTLQIDEQEENDVEA